MNENHPKSDQTPSATVVANGRPIPWSRVDTLESFLLEQKQLPRSVVVEWNGQAVAPSEFKTTMVRPGDRLEIIQIVAGG